VSLVVVVVGLPGPVDTTIDAVVFVQSAPPFVDFQMPALADVAPFVPLSEIAA
jgi:hypothetical protein